MELINLIYYFSSALCYRFFHIAYHILTRMWKIFFRYRLSFISRNLKYTFGQGILNGLQPCRKPPFIIRILLEIWVYDGLAYLCINIHKNIFIMLKWLLGNIYFTSALLQIGDAKIYLSVVPLREVGNRSATNYNIFTNE